MEINAKSTDRNLLLQFSGELDHHAARDVIREVELAIDAGVLTGGGREIPLCEVEVELKSGSQDACDRYAEALATRFGLTPEPQSKFRRALALYKGE